MPDPQQSYMPILGKLQDILGLQPVLWALGAMSRDYPQPYNEDQDGPTSNSPNPTNRDPLGPDSADYPGLRLSRPPGEPSWRVACYNATSLVDADRQDSLLAAIADSNPDILAIGETWLDPSGYKYFGRTAQLHGYRLYSCCPAAPALSQRGRGVALLIKDPLSRYVQSTDTLPGRLVKILLAFRGHRRVDIIAVQAPTAPRDAGREETVSVCQTIRSWLRSAQHQSNHVIFLGDLNAAPNPSLDRHRPHTDTPAPAEESPLIAILQRYGLFDAWRSLHPDETAFSYHVNTAAGLSMARLDSIWCSAGWSRHLLGACISLDDWIPGSHHFPVILDLITLDIVIPPPPQLHAWRRVLDYKALEDNHWQAYRAQCLSMPQLAPLLLSQEDIDEAWRLIVNHLRNCAFSSLPWRNTGRGRQTPVPSQARCDQRRIARLVRRITVVGQLLTHLDQVRLDALNIQIPLAQRVSEELIATLHTKRNELAREAQTVAHGRRSKAIADALERRCQALRTSPGQLMDSILERTKYRGGVDMVRTSTDILSEPEQVRLLHRRAACYLGLDPIILVAVLIYR